MDNKKDLRIVFMGTPEFAVESLKHLVEGGYNIVGVVTGEDKPVGRHGSVLQPTPVKEYALSQGLPILQWAIINGEKETGVTTFFLKHEIDTGEIIDQMRVPIADTDNVGIVYDKLMHIGADLVIKTVDAILSGNVKTIPQEKLALEETLHPAPKIFRETCQINWRKGVKAIYDFIRGLSPYSAAWSELNGGQIRPVIMKIYEAEKEYCAHDMKSGTVVTDKKTFFKVATTDGFIHVNSLQIAGKKRMKVEDFLRGFHCEDNYYMK